MRHEMAKTKNVVRFLTAVYELRDRPAGMEGMGLLYGRPGEGKSTVLAHCVNNTDAVFLRANASWTPTSMLGALVTKLGGEASRFVAPMFDWAVENLSELPQPVFIDEADYVVKKTQLLDLWRDIYDLTGCPVIFIGMEDIARKIRNEGRFRRRITQWIEFAGIDLEDARLVCDTVCEVAVADDLLEHLHAEAKANIGLMVVGLSRIEAMGRASKLHLVDRDTWSNREFFYGHPTFSQDGNGVR